MNRRFLSAAVLGLFLLGAPVDAEQVYIRNRPFKGPVATVSGQVWVDLKGLAEALEVKLQPTESGGYVLAREPLPAEQLAQVAAGQVVVAGTPVESQAGEGGSLLVPLKTAAELLGARVTTNKQLGTVDVVMLPPKSGGGGPPAAGGLGAGVRTINTPGAAVDIASHLSPGIVNVVEFTAPW